ncbi:MAG: GNAT family N-acetyltransferase [Bacillota bacterium]|nr:GNAT family N-acetyltransferase [Bacillota bacterium]
MNFRIKSFSELTAEELWEIYNLRAKVFVVEQECAYLDVDEHDKVSYHIMAYDEDGLQGYARVLPENRVFDQVSFGRVISMKRRTGLGTEIVKRAVRTAQEKFHADEIVIEAQVYVKEMYEKLGFSTLGEEFLEDGIPHIKMCYERK